MKSGVDFVLLMLLKVFVFTASLVVVEVVFVLVVGLVIVLGMQNKANKENARIYFVHTARLNSTYINQIK